jgi:PAS domain S-box-containing protein
MRDQTGTTPGTSLLRRSYRGSGPLIALVLAAAALFFWWGSIYYDHKLRENYLEDARIVSRTFDLRHIQELSGSEADLTTPAYRSIKEQLTGIHSAASNNRFVYLLKQRPDGVVIFLADSEPPSSKDNSPPGQEYLEVPADVRGVFANGREVTVGPYKDRWGRWVSAVVPVTDPESGKTVALLGMDIDGRDWNWRLLLRTAESLALIMVFVLPLLVYVMQRRRSELSLRRSRDEWQNTFDSMPDLITIVDNEHRIVRANRAMYEKLGYEIPDLLGKPCYSVFHGIDSPSDFCPHSRLKADGQSHSAVVFEPRLNGYLDVTVTPLFDTAGKQTNSIHIAHDITERIHVEDALRESEALLHDAQVVAGLGTYCLDVSTGRWKSSEILDNIFGINGEFDRSVSGWESLIHPEDRQMMGRYLADEVLGKHLRFDKEYRVIRHADGQLLWVHGMGRIEYNQQGQPVRMIGTIQNITKRKQVEDELNKKNVDIEQFIYTVSHDLRSPLVTVKTFLGFLMQDITAGESERVVKDIEFIDSAITRMEALLNELLEMSRIGREDNAHETVAFSEITMQALDALAGQIATGRVDIRVSAASVPLCGDRRRLLQVWQNLLENALKYMGDQAEPLIEIGVEQGEETVFTVCDNGIGIDPEYHEKIFGIFEQLDRNKAGVGMGLTMVRRIVEMYGGTIRVESKGRGSGSCFRFTLPKAISGENVGHT